MIRVTEEAASLCVRIILGLEEQIKDDLSIHQLNLGPDVVAEIRVAANKIKQEKTYVRKR